MIIVRRGEENTITVTAEELATLGSPFFLFVFNPDFRGEEDVIMFTGPDVSNAPERANQFILVEGDNGSEEYASGFTELEPGESHLKLRAGQYTYSIYEAIAEPTSVEDTTGVPVEVGMMKVIEKENNNSIYR